MATIALRSAAPDDEEFCFQLHKAAMGDYVAAVWSWDDTVQRAYHARAFTPEVWKIITVDGLGVGVLIVEDHADEVYLARIEIHPDRQGQASALNCSANCSTTLAAGASVLCWTSWRSTSARMPSMCDMASKRSEGTDVSRSKSRCDLPEH